MDWNISGVRLENASGIFHFDFQDYLSQNCDRIVGSHCKCVFLTLGKTTGEWHSAIQEQTHQGYSQALKLAAEVYRERTSHELSARQAELLFGHLARLLVWRIERSKAQLRLMPMDSRARILAPRIQLPKYVPETSLDAFVAASSRDVGNLIDASMAQIALSQSLALEVSRLEAKNSPRQKTFLEDTYAIASRKLAKFGRNSNFLIQSSYLGRGREAALSLLLGQLPALNEYFHPQTYEPYSKETYWGSAATQEGLLQLLLANLMPISLIEGAQATRRAWFVRGYPLAPKVMFTSNAFETDDAFKLYASHNISRSAYVVGQHGNNYGVAQFSELNPEISTSDLFLSWGWNGASNVKAVGVLKPKLRRLGRPPNSVLLILRDPLEMFTAGDSYYLHRLYLESVAMLWSALQKEGLDVKIKAHGAGRELTIQLLREMQDSITLDTFVSPAQSLGSQKLNKYLAVFCYDSTGIIEHAISGRQFVYFAADGLDHISPDKLRN
ncbi:MAG: hypothetical protein RIS08_1024, partial [Actinomycetota bacterium]